MAAGWLADERHAAIGTTRRGNPQRPRVLDHARLLGGGRSGAVCRVQPDRQRAAGAVAESARVRRVRHRVCGADPGERGPCRPAHRADDGRRTQPVCARVQGLLRVPPALSLDVRRGGGGGAAAGRRDRVRVGRSLAGQRVRRSGVCRAVHLPELARTARLLYRAEAGRSPHSAVRSICSLRDSARSCFTGSAC